MSKLTVLVRARSSLLKGPAHPLFSSGLSTGTSEHTGLYLELGSSSFVLLGIRPSTSQELLAKGLTLEDLQDGEAIGLLTIIDIENFLGVS